MPIVIGLLICGILVERYVKKKASLYMQRNFQLFYSFFFATILYIVLTWNGESMTYVSGDAAGIWKTITSFHTKDIYPFYVLYKGINSVYPYVWLYDLSVLFNVNEWFFIKMFYCGAFAYVSSIGFPNMIELLTKKETKLYRRLLFVLVMWYFGYYTHAYTQLMIDLPFLFYYILLINAALKLYRKQKTLLRYIWAGLLCGLCMSGSGQYTMPAVCIAIFILWVTCKNNKRWKVWARMLLVHFVPFLLCIGLIIGWNYHFEKTIVEPLKAGGAWIPSANDWLRAGLIRFMISYRDEGTITKLPSYRKPAILYGYYGATFLGVSEMTVKQYLHAIMYYPLDFIAVYLNSFFLVLSPDRGTLNFFPLLLFYTLLYCSLYIGFTKCKTWKNFFSPLFFIGFSFLWATVPMLVMNIEPRTCLQIRGLIIALAICDGTIWENIGNSVRYVKSNGIKKALKSINRISYPIIFYIIFLCICMMHISTVYETLGKDFQHVLFNLK